MLFVLNKKIIKNTCKLSLCKVTLEFFQLWINLFMQNDCIVTIFQVRRAHLTCKYVFWILTFNWNQTLAPVSYLASNRKILSQMIFAESKIIYFTSVFHFKISCPLFFLYLYSCYCSFCQVSVRESLIWKGLSKNCPGYWIESK